MYFVKRISIFKGYYNLTFIEQRIYHNLFLTRTNCNECERPALTHSIAATGNTGKKIASCLKNEICSKHLATLLNCPHTTAIGLMADCPAILKQNPLHIEESLSILLQHCDMTNILKNPNVFLLRPVTIGERVLILQEIGATKITADKVIRFGMLMKQAMKTLKKDRIISSTDKIIDNMLLALDCPEEIATTLKGKISLRAINISSARDIRVRVMQNYLRWKLQCTLSTIKKISSIYASIFSHSCHTIKQTLEILINDYHFPESKICSNGFLLSLYPVSLENILHSVPVLAGMDIRDCAIRLPRMLCMSPEQLLETEKIVKENNYTNEQLIRCLSLYNLKPITVQQRLETIDNEEELAIRKFIPYVLRVVHSHKKVLRRLKQFRENAFVPNSLFQLLKSEDVTELEKIANTESYCPSETLRYLAMVFNKTKNEARDKISKHPNMCHGSLANTKKVVEYLLDNGVSKEQLWHGVYIVLYSIDTIRKQFEALPNYEELHPFDEWKTHPNFIHLLVYYIEKESDLTLDSSTGKCETIIQNQLEASAND